MLASVENGDHTSEHPAFVHARSHEVPSIALAKLVRSGFCASLGRAFDSPITESTTTSLEDSRRSCVDNFCVLNYKYPLTCSSPYSIYILQSTIRNTLHYALDSTSLKSNNSSTSYISLPPHIMSGLMHKVKDALTGEKNTPEAVAANKGNNGKNDLSLPIHRRPQLTRPFRVRP